MKRENNVAVEAEGDDFNAHEVCRIFFGAIVVSLTVLLIGTFFVQAKGNWTKMETVQMKK